jgi:hypothetical protein
MITSLPENRRFFAIFGGNGGMTRRFGRDPERKKPHCGG